MEGHKFISYFNYSVLPSLNKVLFIYLFRRYFKVLLPILLAASPFAFNGSAVKTLVRAPTIPPATQATYFEEQESRRNHQNP